MADAIPAAHDPAITRAERSVLRRLADRVAELAVRPVEQEKRGLWYRHNALQPTRPVIFCDPENGWNEIITPQHLECRSELARSWEFGLRKEVFWGEEMRDDRVIEPHFRVGPVAEETGWGVEIPMTGGQDGGSFVWDAPIKDYRDLDRLRYPEIKVDWEATNRRLDLASDAIGGILPARLYTQWWWSLGMTQILVYLRGLEQVMLDMIERPNDLHRLMAFLRDGTTAKVDYLEEHGLLSLNNDGAYVGSGGFGWTDELPQAEFNGKVRTCDMWGFGESQETVSVSPGMFEEFVFQYQLPLLDRFGLNCYGCCEPLDTRWDVVERTPRLRRVSVSPWSDVADMAEKLQDRYIFSWKPNPADLAAPSFDEDRIRAGLRRGMEMTRGCRLEVIMKDCHTIAHDPSRVTCWVRIAREEAERYA